jgi:hypothetical protein
MLNIGVDEEHNIAGAKVVGVGFHRSILSAVLLGRLTGGLAHKLCHPHGITPVTAQILQRETGYGGMFGD